MLHFFIDTNVLLSFYAFTQDDLTRLEELAAQVEAGTFVILTTSHVVDEFERNRESKIAESQKGMQGQRLDMALPRLCDPYNETDELRRLAREYSRIHAKLVARIAEDTLAHSLKADQLIERFFSGAHRIDVTREIIERARLRVELGNPPGKRGSIGDAVNWEALLDFCPPDQLFFVTDDVDFYSPLDPSAPKEFLTSEWKRAVGKPVSFVRRLSDLPAPVPQEVLPQNDSGDDRDLLVDALVGSWNFQQTHQLIYMLARVTRFTPRQANDLIAALENSQVGWIIGDSDVHSFYGWLLDTHADVLDASEVARVRGLLDPPEIEAPDGALTF